MDAVAIPTGFVDLLARLLVATACGVALGIDRELANKPAGVRTHALVALGCAIFGVAALRLTSPEAMNAWDPASRVLQGVIAGVGFVGGGVILRREEENEISGLTTAASIWVSASLGIAAALGLWISAAVGAGIALLVLVGGRALEAALPRSRRTNGAEAGATPGAGASQGDADAG